MTVLVTLIFLTLLRDQLMDFGEPLAGSAVEDNAGGGTRCGVELCLFLFLLVNEVKLCTSYHMTVAVGTGMQIGVEPKELVNVNRS